MAESLDAFAELRAMRARLDGIEHRQEMLVRAHSDEILTTVWEYIDRDEMLGEVFLLVDGTRTQKDILAELGRRGTPIAKGGLSTKLKTLRDE